MSGNIEELEEIEETEELEEEANDDESSEDANGTQQEIKVELLPYPAKKDVEVEINSIVIDKKLPLKDRIAKCRFKEELQAQLKGVNFDELILECRFDGNPEQAVEYEKMQISSKKAMSSLPTKKDYINKIFDEKKSKIDAENNKRKEAAKPKKKTEPKKETKYKYPFTIHFAGHNIETDHIFEEGKEYTEQEITKRMLEHQYYEFAGSVSYTYMKDENVLLPIFQQYKKG